MEPQFEELAQRITRDVSAAVSKDVTAAVTKDVTAVVTRDVTAAVTKDVTAVVTRDVTAAVTKTVNSHVTEVVTAAERRLSEQARINAETVRSEARLAAEGYAATLDGINRRLESLETAVTVRLDDHDKVLANHGSRIIELEQKQSPA